MSDNHMRLKPGQAINPADLAKVAGDLDEEGLKAWLAGKPEEIKDDENICGPDEFLVPFDYVETTATLCIAKFKAAGLVQGVTIAKSTQEPKVAVAFGRRLGGYYVLTIDCAEGWQKKKDPEELARDALTNIQRRIARKGMKE